jgi:hypothetical protein
MTTGKGGRKMKGITLRWFAAAPVLAALTVSGLLAQAREPEKISERIDARTAFHMLKSLAGEWNGTAGQENINHGTRNCVLLSVITARIGGWHLIPFWTLA